MAWCWDGASFQGVVDGQKRLNIGGLEWCWVGGGCWVVVDCLVWGRFTSINHSQIIVIKTTLLHSTSY